MELLEVIVKYLDIIITAIGFIVLFFYQRYKIKSLKDQIDKQGELLDYQKGILESLKIYVDIFEPEKIKEFVKFREKTIKMKSGIEIEKLKEEMKNLLEKQIQKRKETTEKLQYLLNEYLNAILLIYDFMYFVSPDDRKLALEKSPDSVIKKTMIEQIDKIPYAGDYSINALRKFFSKNQLEKS